MTGKQAIRAVRKQLAAEFPAIVEGFVREAKGGSPEHLRLMLDLLGYERPRKGQTKPMTRRTARTLESWTDQA